MDLLKIPYEHPFTIEWKLKRAELEALRTSDNGLLGEHNFASKIAGVYYGFLILPFGNNGVPATKGKTWIFFNLALGNVKEIKAKYIISIESANISKDVEEIFKATEARGLSFCESNEFFDTSNGYFVNDEIIIKINGTLTFDRPLVSKLSFLFQKTSWTIKASDLEPLQSSINGYLFTEIYSIPSNPDIKCYLRIYPNGNIDANRGKVFIFLLMQFDNDKKIGTTLLWSIDSSAWSETFSKTYEKSDGFGMELCSTDDLFDATKGYIIDGEMIIDIEGHIFVEKKDPEFLLFFDAIETGMPEITQYNERNFVIAVDGQEIQVNKQLLANVSTVFAGMMQSGMKETIENRIEITDFPFKTVDSAINLLNEISPTFTLEDMLPLLVFADKYDIQLIKDLIEDHLIKELCTSNVCQLIHFATIFNASKLFEKAAEFFIHCANDKIAVNDFDLIDKDMTYKIFSTSIPSISD